METLSVRDARRLALARAGLLKPEWTGFPSRASGRGKRALDAALTVIRRFGYLQLDTVAVAGARSHGIVLLSRLEGLDPDLAEGLLQPGSALFEYWGHEASWIPLELYPAFGFRRRAFREHPWWGDVVGNNPKVADDLQRRIRDEGPLRSVDMEGKGGAGWWNLKLAKKVATGLWLSGELAIRERKNFQRSYDLTERVIPDGVRKKPLTAAAGLAALLLEALDGHGWATTGTLAATWRLSGQRKEIGAALKRLTTEGKIVPCALDNPDGKPTPGWVRPEDLELADRLVSIRPRRDRGVLLSPFDPLLWDRMRLKRLFGFDQVLEIFKPAPTRVYGYYCMPVLAGESLVARFDLKADRKQGILRVLRCHHEGDHGTKPSCAEAGEAARTALERYATALGLEAVAG